ncbi:MAG: hypothetical protein AAB375_01170 [Patescibacteria group bacterium]
MTSPEHIESEIERKIRALKAEWQTVKTPEEPRILIPLELYDEQVRHILADVVSLESAFEFALKNKLTKAKLQMLHDGLDAAQEKLQELDEQAEAPAQSKERRALMGLINKLRTEYPATMQQIDLSAVRDLHHRVKVSYASVQHMLTIDQRRDMRTRIATLSSLVQRVEDERLARVGSAVLAAVSHATEHAPAVAHVAIVQMQKGPAQSAKKGLLATLAGAFRLK